MAAFDLVSFDGNLIGPGTSYDFFLNANDQYVRSGNVETTARRNTYPLVASTSLEPRTLLIHGSRAGSVITAATFRSNVQNWFDPNQNADGPRYLVMVGDDGSTNIRLACFVVDLTYIGQGVDQYVVTLYAPNPIWEANSVTTDTTSPVVNAGNVAVLPSLELTFTGTHATRKRFTVAGAGRGGGLKQVPMRLDIDSTALTASNAYVYVNGVSVPFYVGDAGLVTSFIWVLVDTKSDGSATTVDIVYGAGIVNPKAGALDDGGMDWSETGSSNTVWKWDDLKVGRHSGRAGVWQPALLSGNSSLTAGLTTNTSTSLVMQVGGADVFQNDADSIVLETGGIGFSNLANVSRVTVGTSGAGRWVRTQDVDDWLLTSDWTNTTSATVTTDIALTNGVQIVIGLGSGSLTLSKASGNPWTLTLTDTPTVTLVHTQNLDYYDGTLAIGAHTITFNDFMVDDGTLTIEHGESGWSIVSSVSGYRFYGPDDRISFSDPDVFIALAPGDNTVTNNITGAVWELNYRSGYA